MESKVKFLIVGLVLVSIVMLVFGFEETKHSGKIETAVPAGSKVSRPKEGPSIIDIGSARTRTVLPVPGVHFNLRRRGGLNYELKTQIAICSFNNTGINKNGTADKKQRVKIFVSDYRLALSMV